MVLTDEVTIEITAGKGGDGAISFRHEKYAPKGGPDGGDGGNGGDAIIRVNADINTLTKFSAEKKFFAENGKNGSGAKCKGREGENLFLQVPPGTLIFTKAFSGWHREADLTKLGEEYTIAKGGRGGWGNVHFATSTYQTPRRANPGKLGQKKIIRLEMRLIADVGIIGMPNCGKSTLLARISHAKPKIANYPFTTLVPNLGVVEVDNFKFIAADIPGLIQGASTGKGLGYKFLKHVKRTKLLVHLIDAQSSDPIRDYKIIRSELASFYRPLLKKKEIVAISRADTILEKTQRKLFAKTRKLNPIFLSSVSGRGINDLLYKIKSMFNR